MQILQQFSPKSTNPKCINPIHINLVHFMLTQQAAAQARLSRIPTDTQINTTLMNDNKKNPLTTPQPQVKYKYKELTENRAT